MLWRRGREGLRVEIGGDADRQAGAAGRPRHRTRRHGLLLRPRFVHRRGRHWHAPTHFPYLRPLPPSPPTLVEPGDVSDNLKRNISGFLPFCIRQTGFDFSTKLFVGLCTSHFLLFCMLWRVLSVSLDFFFF